MNLPNLSLLNTYHKTFSIDVVPEMSGMLDTQFTIDKVNINGEIYGLKRYLNGSIDYIKNLNQDDEYTRLRIFGIIGHQDNYGELFTAYGEHERYINRFYLKLPSWIANELNKEVINDEQDIDGNRIITYRDGEKDYYNGTKELSRRVNFNGSIDDFNSDGSHRRYTPPPMMSKKLNIPKKIE